MLPKFLGAASGGDDRREKSRPPPLAFERLQAGDRGSPGARHAILQHGRMFPRREHHVGRPYIEAGLGYEDYGPAYRYGLAAFAKYPGRRFDEVEDYLSRDWASARGQSNLDWARARDATHDAWHRVGSHSPVASSKPAGSMP